MEKKPTRASTRTKAATTAPPVTRTTRAAAKTRTSTVTLPPTTVVTKKASARKPLSNRNHSLGATLAEDRVPRPLPKVARGKTVQTSSDADREPIMAYLRIRPYIGDDEPTSLPYLSRLTDTSVCMTDPHHDVQNNPSRFRPSTLHPSSVYTFSHIFPPDTTQSDFFTKTTLPLVRDVLQGQNGLLFTYGVTNSGKTYTVQGGTEEGSAGILPRTLDVMFNSIDGLHGDGKYCPVRLQGVELTDPNDNNSLQLDLAGEPALAEVLAEHLDAASDADIDPTVLKVDRNYEYTIWLSYAEVYNEKVYDLLASVKDNSHAASNTPRQNTNNLTNPLFLTRKALPLKPSPPSESDTTTSSGRYISGLRQFRIHSASQAKELVKLGQLHRRVFGTLANRESSRSHGMVIIKVVRGHRGERNDPTALQVSRLTLVDLAGSERTKHTHTTGDRLKEAGNINKSLMVLGQCLEVMRANQRRLATSLAVNGQGKDGRMDTRDIKKNLAIVPFRHSKLTEALMDYFIGDGRAVMIVNVNPYDTGYDENSHVMKFAALAREVYITPAPAPLQRVPPLPAPNGKGQQKVKMSTRPPKEPEAPVPYRRKVTISTGGVGGKKASEAVLEILEEDEADDGGDSDNEEDGPINPLVDALFDEIEDLRMQLFESEMKCAIIEAETREEVMREMEERMTSMEKMYAKRLMNEVEESEIKTDAKIDMLHQAGLFTSPVKTSRAARGISEEDDVETPLMEKSEEADSEHDHSGEEFNFDSDEASVSERSTGRSLSPLAEKGKGKDKISTIRIGTDRRATLQFVPDGPQAVILPSDDEDMGEVTETEDGLDGESVASTGTERTEDSDADYDDESRVSEDDWAPPTPVKEQRVSQAKTPQARGSTSYESHEDPTRTVKQPARALPHRVSKLAQDMDDLSLGDFNAPDDSVVILPAKKFRGRQQSAVNSDDEEVSTMKKRKRQLGKKPVVTVEEIQKVAQKSDCGRSIRRMTVVQ